MRADDPAPCPDGSVAPDGKAGMHAGRCQSVDLNGRIYSERRIGITDWDMPACVFVLSRVLFCPGLPYRLRTTRRLSIPHRGKSQGRSNAGTRTRIILAVRERKAPDPVRPV